MNKKHNDPAFLKVDEVTNIMSANVSKLLEREGKLAGMEERAERLQAGTQMFQVIFSR